MRILFVCTGNICRSPTADALLRARIASENLMFESDSAGTHGYHTGDPPDPRAVQIAVYHGINMHDLRARQLEEADFERFDKIIAMDRGHLRFMQRQCSPEYTAKLSLFLEESGLAGECGFDVPDPYYGDLEGFRQVFSLIERGIEGLIMKYKGL